MNGPAPRAGIARQVRAGRGGSRNGRSWASIERMRLKDYLWPFGEYRDAGAGTTLERAAAFRHNRRLARGLPAYLNRWSMISCLLLTGTVVSPPALSPLLGVVFTLAFCMTVHLLHVYLRFRYS